MVRSLFILFLSLFCLLFASSAFAEEGFPNRLYVGAGRGVSDVSSAEILDKESDGRTRAEFRRDLYAGGVFGLDVGRGRYEMELAYRQSDLDKLGALDGEFTGDITATALLFNAIGDFENESRFTPYLGFGLGAAKISINKWRSADTALINDSAYLLAFQVMGGVHYAINARWGIDLGYKYFNTSFPDFKDAAGRSIESDYRSNTLALGARYHFR